jgi:hypothetical protein
MNNVDGRISIISYPKTIRLVKSQAEFCCDWFYEAEH